jgi:protein O-mannosyl-transferase
MAAGDSTVTKRATIAWPIVLGLVTAVLACFAPALQNGFVDWDDDLNLTENARYRGFGLAQLRWMFGTTLGGHYQPLTWLSFAADHTLWGMRPGGYHLTSIALHTANALLVFVLLQMLVRPMTRGAQSVVAGAALVGALLFAIHPLRVESVVWASERRDVLSALFWLAAILAYVRAPDDRRHRRAALVALVLSLLAKAWGITFPLVLLVLDAYPLGRLAAEPRRVLREKLPFAAVAGVGALVAFLAQRSVPDMRTLAEHGVAARGAEAAYGLCFYLAKTVLPLRLHPAYLLETGLDPTRARYVAALATVAAVTALAVAVRHRAPWFTAAWTAYVVILAPVLGLAQTGPQLVADRYTYLACLPWMAVVTGGIVHAVRAGRRRAAIVASAIALAACAALTVRPTRGWHDYVTLWDHTLRLDPGNWVAYTNRGWARNDEPDAALADYSAAIRVNPGYYLAYFDRGNVRQASGDLLGAVADYDRAIDLLPRDPKAYNNRGWVRQQLGDWNAAIADYRRALELAPADWSERALVEGNLTGARARITANGG